MLAGVTWLELDDKALLKAVLCHKKASYAIFSRKSVQLHGRALLDKGLRSTLCCLAVQMADDRLDFLLSQRNYGLPSPKRSFVKKGADCRPSIFAIQQGCQGAAKGIPMKSIPRTCTQRSFGMVFFAGGCLG